MLSAISCHTRQTCDAVALSASPSVLQVALFLILIIGGAGAIGWAVSVWATTSGGVDKE